MASSAIPPVRVRTFYPADPSGVVPGGVDTFIRGLIKWAPEDIEFSVVGMSTDVESRPVGRWSSCVIGGRTFDFFPVVAVENAGSRTRMPLSARYTWGAARHKSQCKGGFDVYEFHRVEPALLYLNDKRPKNMFFHQDMAVIRTESKADILWKWMPGLYFQVESRVANSLSSAWCVREAGAESLRQRYPELAPAIRFIPTWVDTDIFFPIPQSDRLAVRTRLQVSLNLNSEAFRFISVGRLDSQKDPQLLLSALIPLMAKDLRMELLFVGDGVMRKELEVRVEKAGLGGRIRFLGLKRPAEIATLLHASDCFVLSSAYEGMPMALLEALGAGLPVVTTPVGEVARVVVNGINGFVARDRTVEAFSDAIRHVVDGAARSTFDRCADSIAEYVPAIVLKDVYENYRRIGRRRT